MRPVTSRKGHFKILNIIAAFKQKKQQNSSYTLNSNKHFYKKHVVETEQNKKHKMYKLKTNKKSVYKYFPKRYSS